MSSTAKARFQPRTVSPGKTKGSGAGASRTSVGGSTTKRGGAASTAGGVGGGQQMSSKAAVQVIYNGKIVTPQTLITTKYRQGGSSSGKSSGSKGGAAKGDGDNDMGDVPTIDETVDTADKVTTKANKLEGKKSSLGAMLAASTNKKEKEEMCMVCLKETPTEIVFNLPSFIASSDTRDIVLTDERNARYDAVLLAHKNPDGYTTKPTQTMNYTLKNQQEMAAPNTLQDFGCQANNFTILDATKDTRVYVEEGIAGTSTSTGTDDGDFDEIMGFTGGMKKSIRDMTSVSMVSPGCLLDENEISRGKNDNSANNKLNVKRGVGGTKNQSQVSGAISKTGSESQGDEKQPSGSGFIGASNADITGDATGQSTTNAIDAPSGSGVESSGNIGDRSSHHDDEMNNINSAEIFQQKQAEKLLASNTLLKKLQMMERAVQQNSYHRQHLDYRDLPDITPLTLVSEESKSDAGNNALFGFKSFSAPKGPKPGTAEKKSGNAGGGAHLPNSESDSLLLRNEKVKKLFSLSNPELVQGRAISAMAWNAVNTDLLAVGYGRLSNIKDDWSPGQQLDESKLGGLVLFWSLRNPDYPEKILRTAHPVTALDFSKTSPALLAVGFLNGDVSFFDVKREGDAWGKPIESSISINGGHSDPVWQMSWVEKGIERFEVLITISTDGTVLEWNLKKGLAVSKLMQLKKSGGVEGWISREAAGLCFDFCPSDPTCYVAGTEEGTLHRCSVSYNEQFLDTYSAHAGPIYKAKFSERWPSVFLSCSADWTVNLYHLYNKDPWVSMKVMNEDFAVNDISWCPGNSTVFASVNANGKLFIWDLTESSIDPVASVDTNNDEQVISMLNALKGDKKEKGEDDVDPSSAPATPAIMSRYDRNRNVEEKQDPPVTKLINSLTNGAIKRELTCVRFGLTSPIIAVGDNIGTISIYRVVDPVTIIHEGPLQQLQRLKAVLTKNLDPSQLEALAKSDTK